MNLEFSGPALVPGATTSSRDRSHTTDLQRSVSPDAILDYLMRARWQRLPAEYDDPLGMLFQNKASQWTIGWLEDSPNLFLLVWETPSWHEKALWRLYHNGALVLEEADGKSRFRSARLHQLLETPQDTNLQPDHLWSRIIGFQYTPDDRKAALIALMSTFIQRPGVAAALKPSLFGALESELDEIEWPVLDILKVHRLAHKNALLLLLNQLEQSGKVTRLEQGRVERVIQCLQAQYQGLSAELTPMFAHYLETAYAELHIILTERQQLITGQLTSQSA